MNIREVASNGYTVTVHFGEVVRNYMLIELQGNCINWFNFSDGDNYYDEACNRYTVLVNHDNKVIKLIDSNIVTLGGADNDK